MKVFLAPAEMQRFSSSQRSRDLKIGLVPTMGCLHEGHLSLIRKSKEMCNLTVVSIFVNPTQFGPNEDYERYPRAFEKDSMLCAEAGVDAIFHPDASSMYAKDHSVYVHETELSKELCGKFRPGHFQGVTTIVAKLFNIVQPDMAFFGMKDAQQARIIEKMTQELDFGIQIVIAPTVRENDGLAMSSRNKYLSPENRVKAAAIYQSLLFASKTIASGERSADSVIEKMKKIVLDADHSAKIEYIEIVALHDLKPIRHFEGSILIAVAVHIGGTRLIDNIVVTI